MKTFVKRGKRRKFEYIVMLYFGSGEEFSERPNFTHRTTLGGGDGAGAQSAYLGNLAKVTM